MKRVVRRAGACGLWKGMALALGLALAGGGAARAAEAPPNLAGTWTYNPELSSRLMQDQNGDNPVAAAEQHPHHGGGADPFGGGGPMGDGGLSKHQQAKHDADAPAARPSSSSVPALDRLVIEQKPGEIRVADRDSRSRVLKSDGSKVKGEESPDGAAEFRARWDKDGTLRVEVRPAKGRKHTELYEISNDRKHLYVTIESQNVEGVLSHTIRAYDQAPAEAPPGAPAAGAPPAADGQAAPTPPPPARVY